ncbi:DNA base-flipping protein [Halomicronema hongdechloris C2206]|uniref:DNA base-flipping protein n=1 Tax=Halomicronema hongdechloris C2206 TaxID=1641165 RepID=A0A1Z3HLU4_9CYAN|nr:MGMT family protein [Halomicronema hongdechloris]ASC71246.1 DNA base-flipping protein [Halomicronema hongdechloris C2206]
MSRTYDRIYHVVRQIPPGQVATYGQVAELAGLIGQPRLVGYALYRVDMETSDVPWQRVINAKGEISHSQRRHGSDHRQRSLLAAEGVAFTAQGKVDLKRYRWRPRELPLPPGLGSS